MDTCLTLHAASWSWFCFRMGFFYTFCSTRCVLHGFLRFCGFARLDRLVDTLSSPRSHPFFS